VSSSFEEVGMGKREIKYRCGADDAPYDAAPEIGPIFPETPRSDFFLRLKMNPYHQNLGV